jgi:hypothetical protein
MRKDTRNLLELLCLLCGEFVKSHSMNQDVPFSTFVQEVSACQFVSQEVRVELWVRNTLVRSKEVSLLPPLRFNYL